MNNNNLKYKDMENKVRTIDIQAKEWLDRVNGNSYFAGLVTVNYGLDDESSFNMPFQYGYGSQYEQEAFNVLKEKGIIDTTSLYDIRSNGIIVRSSIQDKCLKKELMKY